MPALILVGFFFTAYFIVLFVKHNFQFQTFGLDLGFYDQIIFKASQWDFTKSTIAEVLNRNHFLSFFENDFHLTLLLISLLYKIIPNVNWIFFIQALFSALIGLVVYFIAKAKTQNQLFSLVCPFILLFSVPYQHVIFDGFTPEVFGAFFLALAFLGLVKNNLKLFWISIFGMLVSKVEFSPVVAILGLTVIVFEKKAKQGIITMIIGVLAFILLVYVVNPLISPGYQNYAHYSLGYGQIGQNPQEVIVNLITKPLFILRVLITPIIKLQYLFQQLFSFGFIPLLNPTIFPLLFFELFTRMGNNIMIAKWPLHSYTISVLLAIGTIYFSARFKNKLTIFAGIFLLFSLIGDMIFHGPLNSFLKSDFYTYNQWAKNNQELLDIVPGNVAVSANNSLVPHLSQREKIYLLPNIADAQYIALDLQDRPNAHTPSSYSANKELLTQNRFKIIFQKENAVLLKRL